jgi:sulfur carrier protein
MQIIVNGQARESDASTLLDLWQAETQHLALQGPRGFAIALNGRVVRQVEWPSTPVETGDKVEIIRAMPGG